MHHNSFHEQEQQGEMNQTESELRNSPNTPNTTPHANNDINRHQRNDTMNAIPGRSSSATNPRTVSLMYVVFSLFVATLAVISPPGRVEHHHKNPQKKGNALLHSDIQTSVRKFLDQDDQFVDSRQHKFKNIEQVAKAAATAAFADLSIPKNKGRHALLKSRDSNQDQIAAIASDDIHTSTFRFGKIQQESEQEIRYNNSIQRDSLPAWLRWLHIFSNERNRGHGNEKDERHDEVSNSRGLAWKILEKFVDPLILEWVGISFSSNPSSTSVDSSKVATEIVDKILTSTPRIVSIINLLLAVTYLLHSIVAALFLGDTASMTMDHSDQDFVGDPTLVGMGNVGITASDRLHRSGRERLGGYLLFKLLLISAVVEPDVLDLMILLVWYTMLAFLRSLSYLAGITVSYTAASGQSPQKGVLRLLLTVMLCDISAASTCAALFHSAGIGMVLLLTCDCVLLAIDVFTHLCRHMQQTLDENHQEEMGALERRQLEIFDERRNLNARGTSEANIDEELRLASLQIDQDMESLEQKHAKRHGVLEYTTFLLEVLALMITIIHFVHVWFLHGITFNLVDGVLALHLHSAFSAFTKKILERRNHHRIAQELDIYFKDASDMEITKASASGDVCCICLGTMSIGNIKKVGCGHLYHTHCLREVVERASSFEAARCPLCRASVLDGKQAAEVHDENNNINVTTVFTGPGTLPSDLPLSHSDLVQRSENLDNDLIAARPPGPTTAVPLTTTNFNEQDERALFRFSTEGMLPAWLPIPAFSFEVVRRFPAGSDVMGGATASGHATAPVQNEQLNSHPNNVENSNQQSSILRRLLTMSGAVPMSEEEENAALAQLTEIFPQHARLDLLRELRAHGSAEDVVEWILASNVTGRRRNESMSDIHALHTTEENNQTDVVESSNTVDNHSQRSNDATVDSIDITGPHRHDS